MTPFWQNFILALVHLAILAVSYAIAESTKSISQSSRTPLTSDNQLQGWQRLLRFYVWFLACTVGGTSILWLGIFAATLLN